jgi:hypothetical protein
MLLVRSLASGVRMGLSILGLARMLVASMRLAYSLRLVRLVRLARSLAGLLVLVRLALICRGMGLRLARVTRRAWLLVVVRRMVLVRRWLMRLWLARRRLARVWRLWARRRASRLLVR